MNKKPRIKNYVPKRLFFETLIGYCEANLTKTLDEFVREPHLDSALNKNINGESI